MMFCILKRMSLLVACQWVELELCINRASLFIVKLMLGRVNERYWRTLITWRNSMASTGGYPSSSLSLTLVDRGVATIFALSIRVCFGRSQIWCCCVRKRPPAVGITSMPNKKYKDCSSFSEYSAKSWFTMLWRWLLLLLVIMRSSMYTSTRVMMPP